ncbi:MAG: phosphoglycerate mutase family protein [Vicinamibacterales bacterium]
MSRLILVKHSVPDIVPAVPPSQWRLSEAGRDRCTVLADRLAEYHPDVIVASAEPKAAETARIVADVLGKPLEDCEELHEHDRSEAIVESHQVETVAIVTHGTVMALYVARAAALDPFPLWKRLGTPAFVVLSLPERRILTVVEHI